MKAVWTRPKSEVSEAGVQGVLQAYLPRRGRSPGNHRGADGGAFRGQRLAVSSRPPAVGRVAARRQAPWDPALRQARLHHGRLPGADPRLLAVRAGGGGFGGAVAQRLPGDPAAGPADPGHPQLRGAQGPGRPEGPAPERSRRGIPPSGRNSGDPQAGPVRPGGEGAEGGAAAAGPERVQSERRWLHDAGRVRHADEAGPGGHLLSDGPHTRGRGAVSPSGGVSREGV